MGEAPPLDPGGGPRPRLLDSLARLGRAWQYPSNTPGMALEASWEALRTLDRTLEHPQKASGKSFDLFGRPSAHIPRLWNFLLNSLGDPLGIWEQDLAFE